LTLNLVEAKQYQSGDVMLRYAQPSYIDDAVTLAAKTGAAPLGFNPGSAFCSTNGLNCLNDWNDWNNLLTLPGGLTEVLRRE
jgi:hypothetical protein